MSGVVCRSQDDASCCSHHPRMGLTLKSKTHTFPVSEKEHDSLLTTNGTSLKQWNATEPLQVLLVIQLLIDQMCASC